MPILPGHKELLLSQSESKTLPEWLEFFEEQGAHYTKNQVYSFCYHNGKAIKKLSKEDFSKIQAKKARKYNINQDYFKTWSRNMAYIFGLWCADGCIYGNTNFDITLHNKDRYILKKVAEELAFQGHLYDYVDRQACRLNFSCKVIYDDLIALGGSEQKSMTLKFPNVPREYLADFIRGYFDGDGSVWSVKGQRINSSFTCGSKVFLDKLLEILKEEAGIQGGSYDPTSYSLRFGKADSLKLANYIYKDEPEIFLLRKRERFSMYT